MGKDKKIVTLLLLSVAGALFSGYLSSVKYFTSSCALGESCPVFLGYPACYFGFAMFLAITALSTMLVLSRIEAKRGLLGVSAVSLLGILFAGCFTLKEIPILFQNGFGAYVLGLPTCAWGLLFYVFIFGLAMYSLLQRFHVINKNNV